MNMVEIKYDRNHHAGATPEARIANRLRNDGDTKNADVVTQTGNSARRTFHNIHYSRAQQYGSDAKGVDINNKPRGVV
jgi:hypothetical protein